MASVPPIPAKEKQNTADSLCWEVVYSDRQLLVFVDVI